jgi:hypothetical protein
MSHLATLPPLKLTPKLKDKGEHVPVLNSVQRYKDVSLSKLSTRS